MTYPPPASPDPYGQQSNDPYGQQQPNPYAQQPVSGDPFAQQPVSGDPYAQQPVSGDPYAQPPASPYGQPPVNADPYGQQPPAYGQPAGFPQAPYASAAPVGGSNGLAIGAMVTGIVSIVLGCCCGLFSIPVSAAAIIMGVISKKQIAERGQTNGGMALAGIITGAVGAVIAVIMLILSLTGSFDPSNFDFS